MRLPFVSRTMSRDIALALSLVVFAVSALVAATNYAFMHYRLENDYRQHIAELDRIAPGFIRTPLENLDAETLQSVAKSVVNSRYISSVRVITDYGAVLAEARSPGGPDENSSIIPVYSGNKLIGKLEIGYRDKMESRLLGYLVQGSAVIMFFTVVAVIFGASILIHFYLRRPMERLIAELEKIGRGDFTAALKPVPQRELNSVITAVTLMEGEIARKTDDLKRLATVVEQAAEDIVIADREGAIRYVNPAFQRATGYEAGEVLGRDINFMLTETGGDETRQEMTDAVTAGRVWQGRVVNRRKDGSEMTMDVSVFPIFSDDGLSNGLASVRRDVTHQLELERHLAQSQRMEAIGTLAGGIAHDFNNLLTAIMGFSELTLIDKSLSGDNRGYLANILKASERARQLVKQILAFSRQTTTEIGLVQVGLIVKEAVKFIEAALPSNIEISVRVDSEARVVADTSHIHQITMNLLTNAVHALRQKGGALKVILGEVELDAGFVAGRKGLSPGRYLKLVVEDTGPGIPPDIQAKVFDPFFTTKKVGEGTGMGLWVVKGYVERYCGDVRLYSEPGHGTVFNVYLPIVDDSPDQNVVVGSPERFNGSERVLFVDDQQMIRDLAVEGLGKMGYKVTVAADGEEALRIFQSPGGEFDVVVTDIMMPKMTGELLARHILEARGGMPVIMCTGFSDRIDEGVARSMGIRRLVSKPLVISDLARAIRQVLDEPAKRAN